MLRFGTGGIRARMGENAGELNEKSIRLVAKGSAEYLCAYAPAACAISAGVNANATKADEGSARLRNLGEKKVVVGFDSRHNSLRFARIVAEVFADFCIKVVFIAMPCPTPLLSFLVRLSGAQMGVMITASHNPKEYNGYKLYGAHGGQLTDLDTARVAEFIAAAGGKAKNSVTERDFEWHKNATNIVIFDDFDIYLSALNSSLPPLLSIGKTTKLTKNDGSAKIKVVYSALCGVGGFLMQKLLSPLCDYYTVDSQNQPDGDFSGCDSINPEQPLAFAAALEIAREKNADLVLATDPDADRLGAYALHGGQYHYLDGNQIGLLLAHYLLQAAKIEKNKTPVIIRSLVSSPAVDTLAAKFGAEVVKVPTGFKYIGEVACLLENNPSKQFLLGFEETHGYLMSQNGFIHAADKDGLQAALALVNLATALKNQNQTLIDFLQKAVEITGFVDSRTVSLAAEGDNGRVKIQQIMQHLRTNGLQISINNKLCALTAKDHLLDIKYPTDMLQFEFDQTIISVRPSGTEPLIKFYITRQSHAPSTSTKFLDNFQTFFEDFFKNFAFSA